MVTERITGKPLFAAMKRTVVTQYNSKKCSKLSEGYNYAVYMYLCVL